MRLLKGYIYVGDHHLNTRHKNFFYIAIGILGSLVTMYGLSQSPEAAQIFYVIGSSLLLITSIYFRLFYFIALEIILIAGHSTILLKIGTILQLALPSLLCVQLLVFYFLSGRLNDIFLIIGIIGIAFISAGFAYNNQWVFFFGGAAIAIYAFYSARRNPVSLLWAILNSLFAIIALFRIIMPYTHF